MGLQLPDPVHGVIHAGLPLKGKGFGHHADGQDTQLAGHIGHHGGRAGAGAAAHSGGYKYKIRALQVLGNILAAFLGGLLADLRICPGAQALGDLFTDLDLLIGLAQQEGLLICIYSDELDALQAGRDHAIDSVIAGAAYANHLNLCKLCHIDIKFQHASSPLMIRLCDSSLELVPPGALRPLMG